MRLTNEKVLNDIETYLEETAELPWGTAHIMLMEAKDQIKSLQRQLDNKKLTDEEINDIYDEWQALSGDPVKLYELLKLKAQEK
ncbi:hypothetical protein UFOVP230_29 [uncultured Caudovirales phage]|uniref:Uncharacterized protein n=1 Tax=uncultured Caudovirales phage TaxID=2100421 RepID=A0A6J7XNK3_9CAUD|nr:hypothetical protein UFOVP230_29 [uncultured Caudovirales phage]